MKWRKNTISSNIGWEFPVDGAGEIEGLNGGDIETFLDNPLFSIAKESAQNSLDARLNKKKPVILEFQSFNIKKEDFPDYNTFNKILENLINFWGKLKKDKSAEKFFEKAKEILNAENILCLRISDFNTIGLSGAMQENEPFTGWKKLVKSTGVSDNPSGAGGSFGLGKHASFACSYLRAVLYNTMDIEGIEAYQGVAHLATHKNKEGQQTRRKGYYGNIDGFLNIKDKLILDKNFKRKEPGTDVYILGFNNRDANWKDKIICSIMESFLLALHEGNLIFRFDGEQLDKKTLKETIKKYRSEKYVDIIHKALFDYYDILEGNIPSNEYSYSILEKNDVILKLALETGLSNKISMNRSNGMKIYDKGRSKGVEDYAGVLILKGDKVNEYFRKLENPEHNQWVADRGEDPKDAENKIKLLHKNINESINQMSEKDHPESLDAEGMGEYLPDDFDEDLTKRKKIENIPWEIHTGTIIENKNKNKTKIILKKGTGGKGGGKNKGSGGKDSNQGEGDDQNKEFKKVITANSIRAFSNKDKIYQLVFSIPEDSYSLNAEILISGENDTEIPIIDDAKLITKEGINKLKYSENKIIIGQVLKGEIVKIEFKLTNLDKWALEVELYED
jgi:hypothetical protein